MGQGVNVGQPQSQQRAAVESLIREPSTFDKLPTSTLDDLSDEIGQGRKSPGALSALLSQDHRNGEFLIRGLDIAGSITIFSITMPVMAGAALLIKMSSPMTVLYVICEHEQLAKVAYVQ